MLVVHLLLDLTRLAVQSLLVVDLLLELPTRHQTLWRLPHLSTTTSAALVTPPVMRAVSGCDH